MPEASDNDFGVFFPKSISTLKSLSPIVDEAQLSEMSYTSEDSCVNTVGDHLFKWVETAVLEEVEDVLRKLRFMESELYNVKAEYEAMNGVIKELKAEVMLAKEEVQMSKVVVNIYVGLICLMMLEYCVMFSFGEAKVKRNVLSYKVPNASESDPKKRKGPLDEAREQCDGEIARMFCTNGLSFNLARNPHYHNSYVRASQIPDYVPPGYNALRTTLLQKERKNIQMHLQPLKNTWKQKGVSICSDGWSDPQRRPIFNLIAANESGPMMLMAVNTHNETKTGEMIAKMIIECIKEVGHENVVQIVTENASNCVKAGALISAKFPTIFWTPCVVHTLNLALKNICAPLLSTRNYEDVYEVCYWIKSISEDVNWIKNFIMNH